MSKSAIAPPQHRNIEYRGRLLIRVALGAESRGREWPPAIATDPAIFRRQMR